jgi:predicted nucleic acid-binding protein
MKVLLDTSVAVAALLRGHPSHSVAALWLSRAHARAFDFLFSAHSLAELYAVLTRIPVAPAIAPAVAGQLIRENILSCATVVALRPNQYAELIDEAAARGLLGGMIYDAVIAKVAELNGVDLLVTGNAAHFQQVWPAGAARVVAPQSVAVP